MKDRLIESIKMAVPPSVGDYAEVIADAVLADGWMRPPCKLNETIWVNTRFGILKANISEITQIENNKFLVKIVYDSMYCNQQHIDTHGYVGYVDDHFKFGKTAYHTKEEAEAKLKEGGKS